MNLCYSTHFLKFQVNGFLSEEIRTTKKGRKKSPILMPRIRFASVIVRSCLPDVIVSKDEFIFSLLVGAPLVLISLLSVVVILHIKHPNGTRKIRDVNQVTVNPTFLPLTLRNWMFSLSRHNYKFSMANHKDFREGKHKPIHHDSTVLYVWKCELPS